MVRHSITNVISIDDTNQGGSNVFTETPPSGHILVPNTIAPKPQAILHTQPISDLGFGSFNSMKYHHAKIRTNVSISGLSPWRSMFIHTLVRPPHIPYK